MTNEEILIHHSATVDGKVNDWEAIRKYHTSWRYAGEIITEDRAKELLRRGVQGVEAPWRDIGYHYGIEYIGNDLHLHRGRPLTMDGAHEPKVNRRAIGICFVGCFDKKEPTKDQYIMGATVCSMLYNLHSIAVNKINPHRLYNIHKTCPGKMFDMDALRALTQGMINEKRFCDVDDGSAYV